MAFVSDKTYAQTKYNLTPTANRKTNKNLLGNIVIHYTGTSASAKNNCIYFGTGNRNASADYFIDKDGKALKFNKTINTRYSWHCGDGGGKRGISNAHSLGVEVVSAGEKFTAAQIKTLKALIRYWRKYMGKDLKIVRHYDASLKVCPAPYAGSAAKDAEWQKLLAQIDETYVATADTYSYSSRIYAKRKRAKAIKKGQEVCIVSTWKGLKYLWGKTTDGNWINLSRNFKSKY